MPPQKETGKKKRPGGYRGVDKRGLEQARHQGRLGGGGGHGVDAGADEGVDGDDDLLEDGHALLFLWLGGSSVSLAVARRITLRVGPGAGTPGNCHAL